MQSGLSNLSDFVGNGASVGRSQQLGSMDIDATQNISGYSKSANYNSYEQLLQLSNGGYFQECLSSSHHSQNRPAAVLGGRHIEHILSEKDPGSYDNNNVLSPTI